MPGSENVSHWIEQVKFGDSVAANRIWHHYYERLMQAVQRRLRGQNVAVSDEDDIVLSVFDSFYSAAENGRFPDLSDRDDLWRLLLKMSARKVIDKQRRDGRQRRGGGVAVFSLEDDDFANEAIWAAIGNEPSPEMVLMMEEAALRVFSLLGGGELKDLAVAKMEGHANADLARRFGCSLRTIERRLHLIREKIQQELLEDNEHSPKPNPDCDTGSH